MGRQYTIKLDQLQSNIEEIKVEIIGVLSSDLTYEMTYSDYLTENANKMIVYDAHHFIPTDYYSWDTGLRNTHSALVQLNPMTSFDNFQQFTSTFPNIFESQYIEKVLNERLERRYPKLIVPTVMAISILILILISILSYNMITYFKYINVFATFYRLGIKTKDYIRLFSCIAFSMTFIPFIGAHFFSWLTQKLNLYYYSLTIGFLSWGVIFIIYMISYGILLIFILNRNRINE